MQVTIGYMPTLDGNGALEDARDKAKNALDLLLVAARPVLMHGSREEARASPFCSILILIYLHNIYNNII